MRATVIATCLALLVTPSVLHAQETMSAARDLYASANYDDALVVLGRLESPDGQQSDRLAINQYRAFCLVALGRTAEAEQAIEAVVSAAPLYQPADASPRLRSAFATVRQRILPAIVQQKYAHAKSAFDHQDFAAAAAEFDQVLQALVDPDLGNAAQHPPFSDLLTLATGFRDLSASAATPAPAPLALPPAPAVAFVALPAAPIAGRVYGGTDAGVLPPVILRQDMPPFLHELIPGGKGILEVVINEAGGIESAGWRSSISPRYDAMVLTATRGWKYKPATLDGAPVKYRKVINVSLKGN
jgi:hypothetical protein